MSDFTTKLCTECSRELPATREYFYADKRATDGLYGCCKPCFLTRAKTSRYKDIEHSRARELVSYYRHHDARLISGKQYREANKAKESVRHSLYYRQNKHKVKAYQQNNPHIWRRNTKLWRLRNLDRARMLARIMAHKRRELLRQSGQSYTPDDIQQMLRGQGHCCWWCSKKLKANYHIDHKFPLSKGGSNAVGNICISCPKCNLSKSDKTPAEFNGRLL